ncbi:MAG: hypothetical protein AAGE01_26035, partial [Pseudomonadota bacterium]
MSIPVIASGLQVGDRLPNFERFDADGSRRTYYGNYCGRPLTLLLAIDGDAPGLARAITALAAATGEDRTVDGAIMIVGDPAAATRFREAHPGAPAVFCDDGQISRFIVGTAAPTSGFLTLELDANAHLLARTDGWPAALKAAESADEGRLVTACAPALIVPRVFEP